MQTPIGRTSAASCSAFSPRYRPVFALSPSPFEGPLPILKVEAAQDRPHSSGGDMLSRSAVLIALAMAAVLGAAWAAAPAIGIATTSGDFRIDRTGVSGNATILDGSLVETGLAGSELRLY